MGGIVTRACVVGEAMGVGEKGSSPPFHQGCMILINIGNVRLTPSICRCRFDYLVALINCVLCI